MLDDVTHGDGETLDTDGSTHSGDEPMARVRPGGAPGAALARARVLGAIFGEASAAGAVGRFRVLGRLGAGGMGVVYEAYDPELARGVALKLVEVAAQDYPIALAEAKALARLSHPNVVPIYDFGIARDRVYLVMELVRGTTLRDWVARRTVREVLAVYQQAGSALAAAHDAGLVHRDFKPDNAIVGADGRVRVVDFGLACEAEDPARATTGPRRGGTPHYMAPEVTAGAAITPAADQYGFCVALGDALAQIAERPPRRIAAILERGRAADPAQRFPAMRDLLRALARDPARTWRRVGAVAGLAVLVGTLAFVAGRTHPGQNAAADCDEGAARLDTVWPPAARAAALDRIATLGSYGRILRPQLDGMLTGYIASWTRADRAACRDRRDHRESEAMSDRRTICLQRGLDDFAGVRAELDRAELDRAELDQLDQLPKAVQSMNDPAVCSDTEAQRSDIPPPARAIAGAVAQLRGQITHARIQLGAGRYKPAAEQARLAVVAARKLGYGPVLAEALLVQGHARMSVDPVAAVPILTEAMTVAASSAELALMIEAWARRAYVVGTQTDPDHALTELEIIEPIAVRTASARFARALLYNNVGSVELGRSRRAEARDYFRRAVRESPEHTEFGALELVGSRANLALATDERAEADRLFADATAELARRLGPDHPDTLNLREMHGFATIEDLQQADAFLTPVCQGYELHPALADGAEPCWTEVGLVRLDLGERDRGREAMQRATRAGRDPGPGAYLDLLDGDPRGAARQFADAIAAWPRHPGEHDGYPLLRGAFGVGLGRALREAGDLRGARAALASAIADLEPLVRAHPSARLERQLGRAHVALEVTLRAMNAAPAELAPIAAAAAAWRQRVGLAPPSAP